MPLDLDTLHAESMADGYTNGTISDQPPSGKLDASRTRVTLTQNPKTVPSPDSPEVKALRACTDHMVIAKWTLEKGWADPEIVPYSPLSLMPTASVLQYSTSCFEGMKVFRGYDGRLRLFRPRSNCERMLNSAQRISLPSFPPEELHKLIRKFCELDGPKWLPQNQPGTFLYLRPTIIGSDDSLGFDVPTEATLYVFACYWPGKKPDPLTPNTVGTTKPQSGMRLLASQKGQVRAWPGGTGSTKLSANYGPALVAHAECKSMGYDQVLWLFGPDCRITEAGSTNIFVIWRTLQGKLQLVTPALSEGLILPGVTRMSILELAHERLSDKKKQNIDGSEVKQPLEPLEVIESNFTIFDLILAKTDGRLVAAFVAGTASFIVPITTINFRGHQIDIDTGGSPHMDLLKQTMADIMYGRESNNWAEVLDSA
ncbi:hypothetical protein DV738_g1164, partial [Chaetothyriales sp. CBS 135597]